jgi:hypothetical protein
LKEKEVGMQTWVSVETHRNLSTMCNEHELSRRRFIRELLNWAGERTYEELVRAGVHLPIWAQDRVPGTSDTRSG